MTDMGLAVTDMGPAKKTSAPELKKHAAAIHCSNTLSLLQRKISNALLYHAYKELLIKEEHEITVKNLCNLIGYSGNNHAAIKDALKGLLSTVIEWNVAHDTIGKEDWTASSMLASVSLQGPLCYFAYSPRMKQLLHSPSMFGKINLFTQSQFTSSYGLALYENCIRYRGLEYTKWFEMNIFRKLMGVPFDKYTIFRDFKRRVLDKSVEEVNTYSEMFVEAELQKEGRQVTKIRFRLKERQKKTRLGISAKELDNHADLTLKLFDYGLSKEQAEQVCKEYPGVFILEKINLIESSKNYQSGKIQNIAGYLLSALKNNYQAVAKPIKPVNDHSEQDLKQVEKIKQTYFAYREEIIDAALRQLQGVQYEEFMEKFLQYAGDSIKTILKLQRNKYTAENVFDSPQIKAQLRQYALQELPGLQTTVLTLEKFVETLPEEKQQLWAKVAL